MYTVHICQYCRFYILKIIFFYIYFIILHIKKTVQKYSSNLFKIYLYYGKTRDSSRPALAERNAFKGGNYPLPTPDRKRSLFPLTPLLLITTTLCYQDQRFQIRGCKNVSLQTVVGPMVVRPKQREPSKHIKFKNHLKS